MCKVISLTQYKCDQLTKKIKATNDRAAAIYRGMLIVDYETGRIDRSLLEIMADLENKNPPEAS